jgi:hypothetical protein
MNLQFFLYSRGKIDVDTPVELYTTTQHGNVIKVVLGAEGYFTEETHVI